MFEYVYFFCNIYIFGVYAQFKGLNLVGCELGLDWPAGCRVPGDLQRRAERVH